MNEQFTYPGLSLAQTETIRNTWQNIYEEFKKKASEESSKGYHSAEYLSKIQFVIPNAFHAKHSSFGFSYHLSETKDVRVWEKDGQLLFIKEEREKEKEPKPQRLVRMAEKIEKEKAKALLPPKEKKAKGNRAVKSNAEMSEVFA